VDLDYRDCVTHLIVERTLQYATPTRGRRASSSFDNFAKLCQTAVIGARAFSDDQCPKKQLPPQRPVAIGWHIDGKGSNGRAETTSTEATFTEAIKPLPTNCRCQSTPEKRHANPSARRNLSSFRHCTARGSAVTQRPEDRAPIGTGWM
jgi:hypothetical protein